MLEFYAQIKLTHIATVILSGSLFTLRGALVLVASRFANHALLRWLS